MNNSDWKNLILSVGDSHLTPRPCSPIEVAELLKKAKDDGFTSKSISEKCHFDTTMISKFTNLLKLPKDYWHLIEWGNCDPLGLISFSSAQAIAQHEESIQKIILNAKIKYGFNKDQIYFLGQRIKSSGLTIEECIEESARRRHGPPILFSLLMGSYNQKTQNIIANLTQLEKDDILKEFFDINYPQKSIAAKSKLTGFSLIIKNNELFNELDQNKELIEAKLNEFICQTRS